MKLVMASEEFCITCKLCELYCVAEHSRSRDLWKAFKRESPRPLPLITVEQDGPLSFGFNCRHCAEPECVFACPSGAMRKHPDGTVRVDESQCIGCWTCVLACPYGAIGRDERGRHHAVKCDLCPGREVPACVANCPNRALITVERETGVQGRTAEEMAS